MYSPLFIQLKDTSGRLPDLMKNIRQRIKKDRRNPPIGSNHQLADEMTRVLLTIAACTAVILSIAGLLMKEPVSPISVAVALITASWLLPWAWFWHRIPTVLNRGLILVSLFGVQARFTAGWIISPASDAPVAILTGLIYAPLILFIVALYEGRNRGVLVGMVSALLMGGSIIVGSQRPEMREIYLSDWRLGILVSLCIGTYTFYLARWSDQQSKMENSALQVSMLERDANTDPLTQLLNRRSLDVIVCNWIAMGGPIGVLLLDLDHFKKINDEHGHEVGDEVLRAVSKTIRGTARGDDVVIRWGGEELMVITRSAEISALTGFAERLRYAVHNIKQSNLPAVSASIGVSRYVDTEDFVKTTVARADRALYAAKNAGRNCVHCIWESADVNHYK